MLRTRPPHAAVIGAILLVSALCAPRASAQPSISEVPLPGGLQPALRAIGDQLPPSRAHFLAEFIRRTYDTPLRPPADRREPLLRALAAALAASAERADSPATLPLPLSPAIWIEDVFGGQATPETLVGAILQSRQAALFYCGLLSLDDDTRVWLASRRPLIAELAARHAAAFLAAAPAVRITASGMRLPGGEPAIPIWQALVGRGPEDPAAFVRALVAADNGRVASFFGVVGRLTPLQVRVALELDAADVQARIDAARRLFAIFTRLSGGSTPDERAFRRPTLDPALLLADLTADHDGRPLVPGTRGFWRDVFGGGRAAVPPAGRRDGGAASEWDAPVEFSRLCEQVFAGASADHRARYLMVLFASRRLGPGAPAPAQDAIDAVRAVAAYPALVAALERAGVTDITVFAAAARRAAALTTIGDGRLARLALAQYQGALALVTRAVSRGSVPPGEAAALVSSLSAVAPNDRGEYAGRLAAWLDGWMAATAADESRMEQATTGPAGADEPSAGWAAARLEARVLRALAGPGDPSPRVVEWEGTRYRLDLAGAETARLTRTFGRWPDAHLSAAAGVARIAAALEDPQLTRERLRELSRDVATFALAGADDDDGGGVTRPLGRRQDAVDALQRAAGAGDLHAARGVVRDLRRLADELCARGLTEMAYAAALGQREGVSIPAPDAASRHDFGFDQRLGRRASWMPPAAGADEAGRWRVTGSLLGLDVALSGFSLVRRSARPPSHPPTMNEVDRRVFTETLALVEPAALTDDDRDTIAAALRRGRERVSAARTPQDAHAIAEELRLSALNRTLLSWAVVHDPKRLQTFLSPSELLWLGRGEARIERLRAWGALAAPRLGCLCLQVVDRRPWDDLSGRWHAGLLPSVFPDLNLRLAELLGELDMPAALLGPVLAPATLEFITLATSRDPDDRRGLVEYVHALGTEQLEQYLALLTTDGPLVPIRPGLADEGPAPGPERRPGEGRR